MANMKIKKGDQVRVISGKEAGKTAKVLRVDTEKRRVVLERLNIVKKHTKPNPKTNPQGGVIEREAAFGRLQRHGRLPRPAASPHGSGTG